MRIQLQPLTNAALGVTQPMEVATAHAANPGSERTDALGWQLELLPTCEIPAGDTLLVGGAAVSFQGNDLE